MINISAGWNLGFGFNGDLANRVSFPNAEGTRLALAAGHSGQTFHEERKTGWLQGVMGAKIMDTKIIVKWPGKPSYELGGFWHPCQQH
jgi:hypothetical protein